MNVRMPARGFSLLELLIAMAITTTAAGALLTLVMAGQSIARLQPEAADLQQRARIATHVLATELSRAGAGMDAGAFAGPLSQRFAAVAPSADGGVTIWYASDGGAQGTLVHPLPADGLAATIALDPPCAGSGCGFADDTTALIFDNAGCHDLARVETASPSLLVLANVPRTCSYAPGAAIAHGEVRTFVVDAVSRQLLRRDEATGVAVPVADAVASMVVDHLDGGRRFRVTLRFVPVLLRQGQVPDLVVVVDARPPNLQER